MSAIESFQSEQKKSQDVQQQDVLPKEPSEQEIWQELHHAMREHDLAKLELMLQDQKKKKIILGIERDYLISSDAMRRAVEAKFLLGIKLLVQHGASVMNIIEDDTVLNGIHWHYDEDMLLYVCEVVNKQCADVKEKADFINKKTTIGKTTILAYAVHKNYTRAISLLLSMGAKFSECFVDCATYNVIGAFLKRDKTSELLCKLAAKFDVDYFAIVLKRLITSSYGGYLNRAWIIQETINYLYPFLKATPYNRAIIADVVCAAMDDRFFDKQYINPFFSLIHVDQKNSSGHTILVHAYHKKSYHEYYRIHSDKKHYCGEDNFWYWLFKYGANPFQMLEREKNGARESVSFLEAMLDEEEAQSGLFYFLHYAGFRLYLDHSKESLETFLPKILKIIELALKLQNLTAVDHLVRGLEKIIKEKKGMAKFYQIFLNTYNAHIESDFATVPAIFNNLREMVATKNTHFWILLKKYWDKDTRDTDKASYAKELANMLQVEPSELDQLKEMSYKMSPVIMQIQKQGSWEYLYILATFNELAEALLVEGIGQDPKKMSEKIKIERPKPKNTKPLVKKIPGFSPDTHGAEMMGLLSSFEEAESEQVLMPIKNFPVKKFAVYFWDNNYSCYFASKYLFLKTQAKEKEDKKKQEELHQVPSQDASLPTLSMGGRQDSGESKESKEAKERKEDGLGKPMLTQFSADQHDLSLNLSGLAMQDRSGYQSFGRTPRPKLED